MQSTRARVAVGISKVLRLYICWLVLCLQKYQITCQERQNCTRKRLPPNSVKFLSSQISGFFICFAGQTFDEGLMTNLKTVMGSRLFPVAASSPDAMRHT